MQPATIIPRPARVIEMSQGASFPELSHFVLQEWPPSLSIKLHSKPHILSWDYIIGVHAVLNHTFLVWQSFIVQIYQIQ